MEISIKYDVNESIKSGSSQAILESEELVLNPSAKHMEIMYSIKQQWHIYGTIFLGNFIGLYRIIRKALLLVCRSNNQNLVHS